MNNSSIIRPSRLGSVLLVSAAVALSACSSSDDNPVVDLPPVDPTLVDPAPVDPAAAGVTQFRVRIQNESGDMPLNSVAAPDGTFLLSPGAYIVHQEDFSPILGAAQPATLAIEQLAEDGDPSAFPGMFPGAAVFNMVNGGEPGPIGPGQYYDIEFEASPGDRFSFVTMLIQTNDWFYTSTDEDDSISLFDEAGQPRSGDVSGEVALWDSGTEIDETMGTGPNQPMRQAGPNTGPVEGVNVGSLNGMGKLQGFQAQLTDSDAAVISITLFPTAP